ncbi:hypothetical protein C1646_765410 [Rhizophagus diaphanus]|nr:hypothetical protein C1646_765410 [Rhizophagus diaphanus] [Rhizophagus sp. MUCL 43196]
MLCIASSINLTSPGHFFTYDKALETFGIKFVKQNVTRIPTDLEELKLKIKAIQLEKEQTDMLICDYIVDAFEFANPFENPIFEFCNNINDKGIDQLVAVYEIGINRLQKIVNQEILLTENYTTVGRRERNITHITLADIAKMKKERKLEKREEREKEKKNKKGKE